MPSSRISHSFSGLPFLSSSRKNAIVPSDGDKVCPPASHSETSVEPGDDTVATIPSPKGRRKAVPDSRNFLKYLLALSHNPTFSSPTTALAPRPRSISFHFGVVSDVQYARLPTARGVKALMHDGRVVAVRRRRAWREAAGKLEDAMRAFDKAGVDFTVNLGDAIEGYGRKEEWRSREDLSKICGVFDAAASKAYHVVGNHCRRIALPQLQKALGLEEPYYAFCPADGWRCVVLYSAELCGGTADATEEEGEMLRGIVERGGRTMHHFHGAFGEEQLRWLETELDQAEDEEERVVLFSHHPLADGSARASHVVANTKQVREIVERKGTPVVLCLAGHDHMGELFTLHCFLIVQCVARTLREGTNCLIRDLSCSLCFRRNLDHARH